MRVWWEHTLVWGALQHCALFIAHFSPHSTRIGGVCHRGSHSTRAIAATVALITGTVIWPGWPALQHRCGSFWKAPWWTNYSVPMHSGRISRGPFSQPGQKLGFQESDVGVGDTVPPAVNPLAVRVTSRCQALVISKETNNNKQGLGTGRNGDTWLECRSV